MEEQTDNNVPMDLVRVSLENGRSVRGLMFIMSVCGEDCLVATIMDDCIVRADNEMVDALNKSEYVKNVSLHTPAMIVCVPHK